MNLPCELIAQQIDQLFSCVAEQERIRIRTPFLYPDGDVIDLYAIVRHDRVVLITDYGETLRWLQSQTLSPKHSTKQRQMIDDICLTLGVEMFRGMLQLKVDCPDKLSDSIFRLGQCCVKVADIWLTMRTRLAASFNDEVAALLDDNNIRYERAVPFPGRSGYQYKIDFHISQPEKSTLLNVLSTGSKAFARQTVERAVAAWFDLTQLRASKGIQFVSLFDDSADVWTEEEYTLAGELSDIERWSDSDAFLRKVA